jgi:hypothetical protein
MGEVGQGGEEEAALKSRLPGQIQEGQVLDNQAVGAHLPGQAGGQAVGLGGLVGLEQGVHGHIDARAGSVGQIRKARKLGKAEVFGLHPGGKVFQPQVYGVGPGGQSGQKGGGVPGRSEDFRALGRGDGHCGDGHNL